MQSGCLSGRLLTCTRRRFVRRDGCWGDCFGISPPDGACLSRLLVPSCRPTRDCQTISVRPAMPTLNKSFQPNTVKKLTCRAAQHSWEEAKRVHEKVGRIPIRWSKCLFLRLFSFQILQLYKCPLWRACNCAFEFTQLSLGIHIYYILYIIYNIYIYTCEQKNIDDSEKALCRWSTCPCPVRGCIAVWLRFCSNEGGTLVLQMARTVLEAPAALLSSPSARDTIDSIIGSCRTVH